MGKNISKIVIALVSFIMSLDIVYAQGISVNCPDSAKPGTSFSCTIKSDYSKDYGAVAATPVFSSGLTLGNFSVGSSFENGGFTNSKLSVYSDNDIIGSANVGTFKVNMASGVTESQTITFTDVKITDSNFSNISCSDVVVTIKIDTSSDNEANSNSNNNTSANNYKPSNNDSGNNSLDKEVSTKISDIKISDVNIEFNKDINEYEIEVDNSVTEISLDVSLEDDRASYVVEGNTNLEVGDNVVTITVNGTNGSSNIYTIIVRRLDLSSNSFLESLEIKDYKLNFDKNKFEYYLVIGKEESLDIVAIPEDSDAMVVIGGNENLKTGSNISIVVKAPDGSTSMYSIKIITSIYLKGIYGIIGMILAIIIAYIILILVKKRKNSSY